MTEDASRQGRATELMGRLSERDALDRLIEAVWTGQSRVLVISGDPGVGKTVLLDYLAGRASDSGFRVARVVGVQSEMELAFAGLHQLCAPMLSHAEGLPVPQREALHVALGITPGVPPDRLAAMRKAMSDTFNDPEFLAEATRLGLQPERPRNGEELQAVIQRTYAAPLAVIERLRKLNTVAR